MAKRQPKDTKPTLASVRKKASEHGIESLTAEEARTLTAFRRLEASGKKAKEKEEVKPKPTKTKGSKDPRYSRDYLIGKALEKVDEDGIAGMQALKELRSMLSEEKPDEDLILDVAFVPLTFDDEKFTPDMGASVVLE